MVFKIITLIQDSNTVILNRMEEQEDPISTGSDTLDNILRVILSSSMFLAMLLGFILDNTIPGTPEERGLIKWQNQHKTGDCARAGRLGVYDLPFITPWLQRFIDINNCLVLVCEQTLFDHISGKNGPNISHAFQ